MSPMSPSRRVLGSIGAVLAGVVAIVVLSIATDEVMHAVGALPRKGELMGHDHAALALAYRIVYGILGGYLTARFAPTRPVQHALVLGAIGLVLSTIGAVATWNAGPAFGPRWFPVALAATALPCAWAGARIYCMRTPRSTDHGA
jgi:hypothetical protein